MNRDNIDEDEIDLREVFLTLKSNIGTLFITFFSILVLTVIYLYFSKPIYSSSVIISIDNQEQSRLNLSPREFFWDTKSEERLQLAKVTLQSKKFISTIIDKIDIDSEFFIKKNFKKSEVSEFSDIKIDIKYKDYNNTNLYGDFFEIVPIDKDTFQLKISSQEYNKNHKYNEKIDNEFFSLRVIKTDGESPFTGSIENRIIELFDNDTITESIKPRYYFRFFDRENQTDTIVNNMSVSDLSDSILEITYQDNMSIQAKDVVQEIAKSYIEYNLANKTSELEQTLEFLDKQIIDIKSSLKQRGNRLKKYQQKSGTAVISVGEDIIKTLEKKEELIDRITMQIREINRFKISLQGGVVSTVSLVSAGIDSSSIQSLIESYRANGEEIEALRFQQNSVDKAVTSNGQINRLINELKDKERYIQELLASFTSEHPQVIEAQSELNSLKNKINATIIANIHRLEKSRAIAKSTILNNMSMVENNLKNRLRLLKSNIREKKSLLQSIPEKHIVNENLKRDFALSAETYTFLLQKKIEVEISKASIIANTKILEDAYVNNRPIKPNKQLILMIGLMLGLILGIFYIFIREFFDTKIRNINDIEKLTDIPIYGVLPSLKNKRFFKEALRTIRTNLQFVIPENKESINILISSTVAGEGKTTIVAGLADVISNADKRVLVIDLDLRKPRLYKELKRSNKNGVSNYLTNSNLALDDVIQSVNNELDFFPAGSVPPNPSELLMSRKFDETIKELEKHYDYLIFDSAPIGSVIDANMILKHSDILLLTMKANVAEKSYIENLNRMILEKNIKSTGIILNEVKVFKNKNYGYGYGYGYNYGYDYGYGQEKG